MQPGSSLATGVREMGGGLERYTFEVSMHGVRALAERANGSQAVMKEIVSGWYMLSPRPDPRDILAVKITPLDTAVARVELVIKRTHYTLLALMHEHGDLLIKGDGSVRCACHPGEVHWILREQLPEYGEEFRHAPVQSSLEGPAGDLPSSPAGADGGGDQVL